MLDPFSSPCRPVALSESGLITPERQKPAGETPTGDFIEQVRKFETGLISAALERNQFNQKRAAEELGLRYHQFRGYLRKYGLLEAKST